MKKWLFIVMFLFVSSNSFAIDACRQHDFDGFAMPCPVLNVDDRVIIDQTFEIELTPLEGHSFVMKTVYVLINDEWRPFTFDGIDGDWITERTLRQFDAEDLDLDVGFYFILGWDWLWDEADECYKGPGLNQCETGQWRLTFFEVEEENQLPPAEPVQGIWISPEEIMSLPTSGRGWEGVLSSSRDSTDDPDVSDQDDPTNVNVLAKAMVVVRNNDNALRDEVIEALEDVIDTERGGRTLALGREIGAYVIAADLIGYRGADFVEWVDRARTTSLGGRKGHPNLRESAFHDPTNWGCHARGSYAAIALYLGLNDELDALAERMHDYLGRDGSPFIYDDLWWQEDPNNPVPINRKGATKRDGGVDRNIDGVIPEDQRRAGPFDWPPPQENYVWESLQGTVVAAEILHRAGYDVYNWQDQAIYRAVKWLHDEADFPAEGDDSWTPYIVNYRYGTNFPTRDSVQSGKNMGFTNWTHSSR